MGRYLTRLQHLVRAKNSPTCVRMRLLVGKTTEEFLELSLKLDEVQVQQILPWTYCSHTSAYPWSAWKGCVGRVRCRTPCASMVCSTGGATSGQCSCSNQTCAAIEARGGIGRVFHTCGGPYSSFSYGLFEANTKISHKDCFDMVGRQLFHTCPTANGTQCGQPCPWPRVPEATQLSEPEKGVSPGCEPHCPALQKRMPQPPVWFDSFDTLPKCILPPLTEVSAMAVSGRCDHSAHRVAKYASFTSAGRGVFPVRPPRACFAHPSTQMRLGASKLRCESIQSILKAS